MEGFKDHIKLFEDYIETFINDLNDNAVYEPIKYFLKLSEFSFGYPIEVI